MAPLSPIPHTGLVLAGGGARGAYEAGVLAYLREELEPRLGPLGIDIISGTSVGAINAAHVAAHIEHPRHQAADLIERWRSLSVDSLLRFGFKDLLRMAREIIGGASPDVARQGGLVDPVGLRQTVFAGVHWPSIGRAIRRGSLHALAVTATHVASGRSEVFIQRAGGGTPPWTRDPHLVASATHIGPKHVLASAAIPLLFPAVRVRSSMYVDGGLRMNVPLTPVLRLGAERVIVVSLRHDPTAEELARQNVGKVERVHTTAPFLLGKTLDALMVDRTDQDLGRLRQYNDLLESGVAAYGPSYADVFNSALTPRRGQPIRYVRNILVRPSRDLGELAATYAASPEFRRKARGLAAKGIARLATDEGGKGADLISYLLFDGGFADVLIDLGRRDARAQEEEWARFWSDVPQSQAELLHRDLAPHRRAG